eukprot:snap_masked-scaffold_9-processed-gene-7.39-mRNA-1 protein AED:0.02 eAED:0.02 QI:0/-1/0/1/-1/1/1/0/313
MYITRRTRPLMRSLSSSAKFNFGIQVVPQQTAYVVERLGKFQKTLPPGLHLLVPFVDKISYIHSLKETPIPIPNQQAITQDNVTISIDGVLYVKIVSPEDASYGVNNVLFAVTQLAQTAMRSELGKITLDKTFEERETLNQKIVRTINEASKAWGIQCLRYEIRDISPPAAVRTAMDSQAEAERHKRAKILESEGERRSVINMAESEKQSRILEAEAVAESTLLKAKATAQALEIVGKSIQLNGQEGAKLRVAEKYIAEFGKIAQKGNVVLLGGDAGDVSSMVAKATSVYKKLDPGFLSEKKITSVEDVLPKE